MDKATILAALNGVYKTTHTPANIDAVAETLANYGDIITDDNLQTFVDGAKFQLNATQSVIDKSTKTLQDKVAELTKKPQTPEPQLKPTEQKDEIPEWAKQLLEFQTEQKAEKKRLQLSKSLSEKLKSANINPDLYKPLIDGKEFGEDSEIDSFVDSLKTIEQNRTNQGLGAMSKPFINGSQASEKADIDASIKKWANQKREAQKSFTTKTN